ncbi:MAG: alcohol dehydrogenase [Halieaceae bacterium]|jgi:(R,R)-butanediol dehydrogenase/meso-butanediol dehydrogenase/diacetyl reductase|nr:alcohol dehydrogenase [Halieaceae bacterium]MDG1932863.1 zinc-binding dehydrogenase [Luminiphilus sp.]MDG2037302.1 zinc-binding dehydrogenase [Luminiphilus sp.]|tara:strand:+ start:929 stop:1945 length:1017 start_codon:yes stop_codon:yes gene_type:complete
MKAAVLKSLGEPLQVETVPDPSPEAAELVVKVSYCGICGTDLHSTREGPFAAECDSILGHEFCGHVAEVGSGLKDQWEIGDRVTALPFIGCGVCVSCVTGRPFECAQVQLTGMNSPGGFAEYVKTGASETLKLPDDLAMQSAALIEPLAVGLHAVRIAQLKAGERVLIIGGGPVGLAVSLWCQFFGARDVLVSEMAEQRLALATQLGATGTLTPGATLGEEFGDVSGGAPDVIFECVGAPGLLQETIEIAPRRSRIVPVGVCEQPDTIVPVLALVKELRLYFAIAYNRDDFETVIAMLGQHRIDATAMITDVVKLDEMPAAFEALRSPTTQCKVLTEL